MRCLKFFRYRCANLSRPKSKSMDKIAGRTLAASTVGQVTPSEIARVRKEWLITLRSGKPKEMLLAPRV